MSVKSRKKYDMNFDAYLQDGGKKLSFWQYYDEFAEKHPEIAEKYFHMRWNYRQNDN